MCNAMSVSETACAGSADVQRTRQSIPKFKTEQVRYPSSEIKHMKPSTQYKLHQECVCLLVISQRMPVQDIT